MKINSFHKYLNELDWTIKSSSDVNWCYNLFNTIFNEIVIVTVLLIVALKRLSQTMTDKRLHNVFKIIIDNNNHNSNNKNNDTNNNNQRRWICGTHTELG